MSSHKILIVEDEEFVRKALERLLRRDGYTVLSAPSAEEALKLLREEEVDLVISDHLMPGMKGLEFLEVVRQRLPETLRIVLTGYAETNLVIEAINKGEVYRFLTKPWNDDDLRLTIRLALRHRELEKKFRALVTMLGEQEEVLQMLELRYPGISNITKDSEGTIVIS